MNARRAAPRVALVLALVPMMALADSDANRRVYLPIVSTLAPYYSRCKTNALSFTSRFVFRDWFGGYTAVADLCNPTADAYTAVKYEIDALDPAGGLVASVIATDYRVFWPNETMCIGNGFGNSKLPGVAFYRFSILAATKYGLLRPALTIVNAQYDAVEHGVRGSVRNDSQGVYYPYVATAFHDATGQILGCADWPLFRGVDLSPGLSTDFTAYMMPFAPDLRSLYNKVASMSVVATIRP